MPHSDQTQSSFDMCIMPVGGALWEEPVGEALWEELCFDLLDFVTS